VRRAIALLLAVAIAGCGSGGKPELTVSAAASLNKAFTEYGRTFRPADVRFSFAGSDQLAAQIRAGARPDVYAAANTKLPASLHAAGLVERPKVFAANRLVLAVAASSKIRSLSDVARPGVTVAMGSPSVPVGAYAQQLLRRLPGGRAILRNVRSREPDVAGVVGKVTQGAVDAGFVYVTDVTATNGRLRAIGLPHSVARYAVAVVRGTKHRKEAELFVGGLLSGEGRRDLLGSGFAVPQR
jgi:molybdate transport system substrate-binding protein